MAAPPDPATVHTPASQPTASADVLRLSLTCPQCGVTGWIKWTSLARGIHCPKCRCEFLIAKNGQIASFRDLPQTRYSCPRCGKSGSLPTQLAVRKTECVDCKLPLVAGPDRQLHGVKEAAELKRAAEAMARNQSYGDWLTANLRRDDGQIHRWRALATVVVVATVITLAVGGMRAWFDDSLETQARRFTQACLSDSRSGLKYLEQDDVQRVEFERWWMRHFASLEEKHRPAGDRVAVDVEAEPFAENAITRTLRVQMTSEFLGTRKLEQVWRQTEGRWVFDSSETLVAQDGVILPPKQQAPATRAREAATPTLSR